MVTRQAVVMLAPGPGRSSWNTAVMSGLRMRIGGDGPVVVESDATGWRLIVREQVHASGVNPDDLHTALRDLALRVRELAHDAFGVVCNCAGAWEDEYTEEHGEDALPFEDWLERIEYGGTTIVTVDGELLTGAKNPPPPPA